MNRSGLRVLYLFSLLVTAVAAPAQLYPAQATAETDSLLQKIVQLYEEGSFLAAEIAGRRLIEQGTLSDTTQIQVEKYIAFSLIAQDKPQSAVSHFRTILQIDSTFNLDPQLTSPKILSVFQQTREKYFTEHQQVNQRELPQTISTRISYRAILFPGWEQVYQGRKEIGYTLLAAGAASLLSTVYCDFQCRHFRDVYMEAGTSSSAAEEYERYNRYHRAEIISAVIFGLTYILSEVEIFIHDADETVTLHAPSPQNTCTIISLKIHL